MGAKKLAAVRKERGMTQKELAEECDVSRMTVYRWEKDGLPSERVEQVASALGVDASQLSDATGLTESEEAVGYVSSEVDASEWRDQVVGRIDDFELRALLMSLTSKEQEVLDRRFWVIPATLARVAEAVNAPREKVEELWPNVLKSGFVEKLGDVEYCLALRFPED